MSKENVKKFFIKVEQDETVRKNFLASIEGIKPENQNEAAEKIIQTAKAAGFEFNTEDLFEARAELIDAANSNQELSDEALNSVSGGNNNKTLPICVSVATVGLGCAVMSIVGSTSESGCGTLLTTNKNDKFCK